MIIQHDYLQMLPWPKDLAPADLVFADPPYNIGAKYADDETGDHVADGIYRSLVSRALMQLDYRMRPGATLWWLCPANHLDWLPEILHRIVGPRLYTIVWHETFAQYQGNRSLTRDFRLLFCHVKGTAVATAKDWGRDLLTFNPDAIRVKSVRQMMNDKRANQKGRVPGTVWKVRRLQGNAKEAVNWHPNQIPPEILDRIILGWSNPGDVVVDAFAGSGSMGLRCQEHGRRFVGIDKSATYCKLMKERLDANMPSPLET